jgi:hypothetical protein
MSHCFHPHSFSELNNTPLYGSAMLYISMDGVVSTCWLLFEYLSRSLGVCLEADLLGPSVQHFEDPSY